MEKKINLGETVEAEWAGGRGRRRGENQNLKDLFQDGVTGRLAVPFIEIEKPGEEANLRKKSSIREILSLKCQEQVLYHIERAKLKLLSFEPSALGDH